MFGLSLRSSPSQTIARIDTSARETFGKIWILNTYERKHEHVASNGQNMPRALWENIDGTRGLQYSICIKFPGGVQNRIFNCWITWDLRTQPNGREIWLIAMTSMKNYPGTCRSVEGRERFFEADTEALYVVRALTDTTCEWTRIQTVDLKMMVPRGERVQGAKCRHAHS